MMKNKYWDLIRVLFTIENLIINFEGFAFNRFRYDIKQIRNSKKYYLSSLILYSSKFIYSWLEPQQKLKDRWLMIIKPEILETNIWIIWKYNIELENPDHFFYSFLDLISVFTI